MDRISTKYNFNKDTAPVIVQKLLFLFMITVLANRLNYSFAQVPKDPQKTAQNTQNPNETLIDRVVADVNGEPILYSEIKSKLTSGLIVLVTEYPASDKDPNEKQALQDAINFKLIMQKADELEIEVSDQEVDDEINKFIANRGLTHDKLVEALQNEGMTYEKYKQDFKHQMLLRRFQGRVIGPAVKITDKDIETFYLKKTGMTADNVRLTLRQILIKMPSDSSEEVADSKLKLIREAHNKLLSGMSFIDAVKAYSDQENSSESGGLMVGIKLKDLSDTVRNEVKDLNIGQFTAPIRTPLGLHLFYLEEKKFTGSDEFQNVKKNLELELRTIEINNQTKKWIGEQRRKSRVNIIE